jgi:hypothetical protein
MAFPWHRTQIKRKRKRKTLGAKAKNLRENKGTTAAIPATGPLPTLKYGRVVADSKVQATT